MRNHLNSTTRQKNRKDRWIMVMMNSWAYPKMAKENPFYAQVWNPQHSPEEDYEIPMQFSAYDIEKELKEKLGL